MTQLSSISMYATKAEKKAIYAAAKKHKESASQFAKRVVLGHIAEDHNHPPQPLIRYPQHSED